jgi:hypothetical protein
MAADSKSSSAWSALSQYDRLQIVLAQLRDAIRTQTPLRGPGV